MVRGNEFDQTGYESRGGQQYEDYVLSENLAADDRESIWTIPTKLKRWYFALFSIQVVLAAVVLVRAAIADENTQAFEEILTYIWQYMAPAAVASAAFTLVIIDGINGLMVLSTWLAETLEKRRRKEEERRRREEERHHKEMEHLRREVERIRSEAEHIRLEVQEAWLEWNRRREAAAAAGENFTEPPPGIDQETPNAQQN